MWRSFTDGEREAFSASAPARVMLKGELPDIAPLFIPARYYRPNRRQAVKWVVLHTAECTEAPSGARAVAHYFETIDREASAHFCVDRDEIVQCVSMLHTAFAAPPLNDSGVHVELVGVARQTPEQWADDYSTGELERAARLVRAVCERFSIPLELVDADGLKAGKGGITTHFAVTSAFHQSDHVDPGPNFPAVDFLTLVQSP